MANIGGYSSPVDLGLGQVPITTEPELFEEFTGIYNAIHLLNASLDSIRSSAGTGTGPSRPEDTPDVNMPFTRFFTAVALRPIVKGNPICPFFGSNGFVNGALANNPADTAPNSNFCTIALSDAAVGVYVRVGIGPAIVPMAGIRAGQRAWAYSSIATNGNIFGDTGLYSNNPGVRTNANGTAYAMPVATCVVDGYIMFGQYLAR